MMNQKQGLFSDTSSKKAVAEHTQKVASSDDSRKKGFQPLDDLFSRFELQDKGGYISQEFQDFGYRLAVELDDMPHKSLYIKMAKNTNRGILESALSFVKDASTAKSKARLFMWKVKQLKEAKKAEKAKKESTQKAE